MFSRKLHVGNVQGTLKKILVLFKYCENVPYTCTCMLGPCVDNCIPFSMCEGKNPFLVVYTQRNSWHTCLQLYSVTVVDLFYPIYSES